MRVIVCGGRDYKDYEKVATVLSALKWSVVIVHGAATGADTLAAKYAEAAARPSEAFPARWGIHGKKAGPLRNQQMLDAGADMVIAFPGGRGTEDMKQRAREAGIPVLEVT